MKNLLQVNRAFRAKKNLNFKSIKSTTKTKRGLNEVLCLSKRGFLLLGLLLTLGVGQMWAGTPYMSRFGIQFRDDGGTWFKTGYF